MEERRFGEQVGAIQDYISELIRQQPPFIHCSKINSFIRQLKEVGEGLEKVPIDPNKRLSGAIEMSLLGLHACFDRFQSIHAHCCHDSCAATALGESMREIRTEFEKIRKESIKHIRALGFAAVAEKLALSDSDFDSQDQVDVKMLLRFFTQKRIDGGLCAEDEAHLKARLLSLNEIGVTHTDERDSVTLPELPSMLNLIMRHDEIELGESVGYGSGGVVRHGVLKATGQSVAVKVLETTSMLRPEVIRREIMTMARLKHSSLLPFLGYTKEEPYWVVTEYMENGNLYDILETNPDDLTAIDRTQIAFDVACGMEYLHGRGIVHRDLKSQNVLLDERKRARICDFGLVRIKSCEPMTGWVGTMGWMAPEVLLSLPFYDEKVDVYSFGILLWELLTSMDPCGSDNLMNNRDRMNFIARVVMDGMRPPIPPECPTYLQELIEECWQLDPKRRPTFHEIMYRLSDPRLQYPGCGLFMVWQIPTRRYREIHSLEQMIESVSEAISTGDSYRFDVSIRGLERVCEAGDDVVEDMVTRIVNMIDRTPNEYATGLIHAFFNALRNPRKGKFFHQEVVRKWLLSNDDVIVTATQNELFCIGSQCVCSDKVAESLLSLSTHPTQTVRVNAVLLLLSIVSKSDYWRPELLESLIQFTVRKLPPHVLEMLLRSSLKLCELTQTVPNEAVIGRIMKLHRMLSVAVKPLVAEMIANLFRFESVREMEERVWDNVGDQVYENMTVFKRFVDVNPKHPKKMLQVMFRSVSWCDPILEIVIDLMKSHPAILPLVADLLPVQNKNEDILTRFYRELLELPKILAHSEFYSIARRFLTVDDSASLRRLLSKNNVNHFDVVKFDASSMPDAVMSLFGDESLRTTILRVIFFRYCGKINCLCFRGLVKDLFAMLDKPEVSRDAFLCLAGMAKFDVTGFDIDRLLIYAAKFAGIKDSLLAKACMFVFRSYFGQCSDRTTVLDALAVPHATRNFEQVAGIARVLLDGGGIRETWEQARLEGLLFNITSQL